MAWGILILGLNGCGKTTVGRLVSQRLECPIFEADASLPPDEIARQICLLAKQHEL